MIFLYRNFWNTTKNAFPSLLLTERFTKFLGKYPFNLKRHSDNKYAITGLPLVAWKVWKRKAYFKVIFVLLLFRIRSRKLWCIHMNEHFYARNTVEVNKNQKIKCSRMNFRPTIKNSNYPNVKLHDFKAGNFKELTRTTLPEAELWKDRKPDLNQRSQRPINRNRCPN